MADQTAMSNGPDVRIHSPFTEGIIGNIAEFGNDTFELLDLQAKLTACDAKEASRQATVPFLLAVTSGLLILGLTPVALAGIGLLLHEFLEFSPGTSLLIAAGGTLVIAVVLALIGISGIKRSLTHFDRSRDEFTRNLAWIKTVLSNTSRQNIQRKGVQSWFGGR